MTIKGQIRLGFGLVTALVLTMGALGAFLLNDIRSSADRFGQAASIGDKAREAEAAVARIKVPVNQWLRSESEQFVKLADTNLKELGTLLDAMANAHLPGAEAQIVDSVEAARRDYIEHWKGMQERATALRTIVERTNQLAERLGAALPVGDNLVALLRAQQNFLISRSGEPQRLETAIHGIDEVIHAVVDAAAAGSAVDAGVAPALKELRAAMTEVGTRETERTRYLQDFTKAGTMMTDESRKLQVESTGNASTQRNELERTIGRTLWIVVAAAGAISLIAAGISLAITRIVSRPLDRLTQGVGRLAAGDLDTAIKDVERRDEIGAVASAVDSFRQRLADAARLRDEQDLLKQVAEQERRATLERLAGEFEANVKAVVHAITISAGKMQRTAQSMSATAEETERQSATVATAAEQATTNVQTVAGAAEELSASIAEISRQVSDSANITGQAVSDVERTNAQVRALAAAAERIGDVIKLINDIASQTNLLALNATIEAARAGDAGKGFAVVASEVKSLATQTAKATDDIAAQIKSIQGATTDSVQAIQAIGQTIGRLNQIATTIASAVEQQGAATAEIARNVQQASAGTTEVSSNIAGVNKAAGETGSAAGQVLAESGDLARQSETLLAQGDAFIATIRAA